LIFSNSGRDHGRQMTQDLPKIQRPEVKVSPLEHREALFPARRRLLLIEDDASMRRMLSAFLTSMQCECVTVSLREALAFLRRKAFDAVLVDFGPSGTSVRQFLPKMQKLRPDLMGKTLVITREAADIRAVKVLETYDLPRVPESRLIQELWSNLQPLFSSSGLRQPHSVRGPRTHLVFDSFCQQSPNRISTGGPTARHLVYKCDGLFVDLLIGPLPEAGRVKVVGQVIANPPGKVILAALPVGLVNRGRILSHAITNQLGEFQLESSPDDDLAVRIETGPNSWIETPLQRMNWIRESTTGLRV
jgi:CheY-like chemotaxis protein